MSKYIESPAEIAVAKIRRELQRMSETIAVAGPYIEDAATADMMAALSNVYARLKAASAELDAIRKAVR